MPKLEYKSDSDNDENENKIIETTVEEKTPVLTKPKKQRSEKQIEVTNRMREALKLKKENDKKLKKDLEDKLMNETLNHKLIKKEINKKVNMKLKKIVDTSNQEASDSDDEEVIIIPKRKSKLKKEAQSEPVKEQPIKVKETQPIKRENNLSQMQPKPLIRFV